MADFIKRAEREAEQKQVPLPIYEAEVTIDGSIVTLTLDLDKVAAMSVEREGERDEKGKPVKYMKNPAVMLKAIARGVQVCQVNPADGIEYMLECDFQLGQGGNGVYANFPRTKKLGTITDGAGLVPAKA